MKKNINFLFVCFVLFLASCSSKPTNKEISKKILLEYVCAETARVNNLKIESTEETKNLMGKPAYRYTVSGEVEWPKGCTEFGTGLEPGAKESFQKIITLSKGMDGDWQ